MKKIILSCMMLLPICVFAQNSTPFKMPAEIKFDKNVVQKLSSDKGGTISYYFTKSGDFAALQVDDKKDKNSSLIIYTKEGNMLIVNDKEKSIIIMNMGKFIGEAAKAGREMAKDKNIQKDSTVPKMNFRKTGNTKMISGYTAEEYEIKRDNDVMNVWYLKADFDANLFGYMMGMGKMGNMPAAKNSTGSPDFNNIPGLSRNYFMAEMEKNGKKMIETISINNTDFSFSSAGYTIRDMADLMKGKYN